jgi:hypothetical protein
MIPTLAAEESAYVGVMAINMRVILSSVAALVSAHTALAQQPAAIPPCPAEQARAFEFLAGSFRGTVFDLHGADSSASGITARATAAKILSGCALEERWHFEQNGSLEGDVEVLRAFDASSTIWSYDIATVQLEHVTWMGELIGGEWYFNHSFPGGVRARIKWVPTGNGYSEQVSRSTDGGKSWVNTRHINFARAQP